MQEPFTALAEVAPWAVAGVLGLAALMFSLAMIRDTEPEAKPKRAVVIDDDPAIVRGLKGLIESRTNFGVVGAAHTGRMAVHLVNALEPDLVVIDVKLPEMDGIEATRRIKALHPEIPVIGFSSPDDDATGTIMRRAGASAHLVKGDSPETIIETIQDFS